MLLSSENLIVRVTSNLCIWLCIFLTNAYFCYTIFAKLIVQLPKMVLILIKVI